MCFAVVFWLSAGVLPLGVVPHWELCLARSYCSLGVVPLQGWVFRQEWFLARRSALTRVMLFQYRTSKQPLDSQAKRPTHQPIECKQQQHQNTASQELCLPRNDVSPRLMPSQESMPSFVVKTNAPAVVIGHAQCEPRSPECEL